jgi:nucleoside-diphosphate-sugar epimerase
MRRITGWEPQWAFDDGVRKLVAWVGAHLELFRADEYVV